MVVQPLQLVFAGGPVRGAEPWDQARRNGGGLQNGRGRQKVEILESQTEVQRRSQKNKSTRATTAPFIAVDEANFIKKKVVENLTRKGRIFARDDSYVQRRAPEDQEPFEEGRKGRKEVRFPLLD